MIELCANFATYNAFMDYVVKILEIKEITHDVKSFRVSKPPGYQFTPGQATDLSIARTEWKEEKRPFTFTSLNYSPYLEFTIKRYPEHKGVTDQLHQLSVGEELIIGDPWGAISYQGPGIFIAGGAGITPFMAILRQLYQDRLLEDNILFFSNKTAQDIIYHEELFKMLGKRVIFILSRETNSKFCRIDDEFLEKEVRDFSQHFYICGPDKMVQEISSLLSNKGASADSVVFEK
jgi:ferredoxin-NADP reductase